jgi:hypothetical protein
MNAFDRSEDDILWIENKNADAEGDSELVPESSSEDDNRSNCYESVYCPW